MWDHCSALLRGILTQKVVQNAAGFAGFQSSLELILSCFCLFLKPWRVSLPPVYPSVSISPWDQPFLEVAHSRSEPGGDRSFSVARLKLWNRLPPYIRSTPNLEVSKPPHQTHFFSFTTDSSNIPFTCIRTLPVHNLQVLNVCSLVTVLVYTALWSTL